MGIWRKESVVVEKPLRIDFAGGWSDTPPICFKMGGCVLNGAISLGSLLPVRAEVAQIDKNLVIVESVDLKKKGTLSSIEELHDHSNPADWMALVKSALVVIGYDFSWGGCFIRISADVPKGSGLGTSSILGAALLEALALMRGECVDWRITASRVLLLEQEMGTGGGWQDQVGALLPGVKLLETNPGKSQRISVTQLDDSAILDFSKFLDERALLLFTGRKRMARNVLRGVVKFFDENPDGFATEIISTIKKDARDAFDAIKNRDWEKFCATLNAYWLNKKALDPGSTNPLVESIIARIAPWTSAVSLCGAGGGGFMLIIARDGCQRDKIRSTFERFPPVRGAKCFDFSLIFDK